MDHDQSVLSATSDHHEQCFVLLDGATGSPGQLEEQLDGERHTGLRPLTGHSRLSDAFFAAAKCYAHRPALTTGKSVFRYADLARQALRVADQFLSDGTFEPGDRVAMMLDNGPEFIAAYFGILAAGGVVVPLPSNIEWSRFESIARICNLKAVVSSRRIASRRGEIADAACVSLELGSQHLATEHSLSERSLAIPKAAPLVVDGQSLAMIMFTSGSSGDPKGVMLSDRNLLANTESILKYLPIGQDDRALALLPFYHAFGHSIVQTHLLSGATLVVDGNMAFPSTIVDALQRHRATSFSAVPEGFYSLLAMSDLASRELPDLRYMSVAGGALKPDAVIQVAQSIAPAEFYVMYGQTEASARLAFLPAELAQNHANSIGIAIPDVDLRVLNSDGQEAAEHETGELCARGANVMLGYWNDPDGTAQVIRNGWLCTGDLAARDEQGYLYVKARKNDLVKVQGFRVHPREVEDAISEYFPDLRIIVLPYQHQDTTRLALYGITSKVDAPLAEEIRRICMRELPRHKNPSFVEVLTQAPLNASMKLDRAALKRHAELHASLAAEDTEDGPSNRRLSA